MIDVHCSVVFKDLVCMVNLVLTTFVVDYYILN